MLAGTNTKCSATQSRSSWQNRRQCACIYVSFSLPTAITGSIIYAYTSISGYFVVLCYGGVWGGVRTLQCKLGDEDATTYFSILASIYIQITSEWGANAWCSEPPSYLLVLQYSWCWSNESKATSHDMRRSICTFQPLLAGTAVLAVLMLNKIN